MTIKFPKGSFVRALDTAYGGGAYIKGETYEVKQDFHENGSDNATVYTVEDSNGSKSNGWSQKFFEAVPPPRASYAHSPGYQQGTFKIPESPETRHCATIGDPGHDFNVKKPIALQSSGAALLTQVGGAHYTDMTIQPIEYIQANRIPFPEGNIIKYVSRWRAKGGIKDLEKAKHHLELLIEFETAKVTK